MARLFHSGSNRGGWRSAGRSGSGPSPCPGSGRCGKTRLSSNTSATSALIALGARQVAGPRRLFQHDPAVAAGQGRFSSSARQNGAVEAGRQGEGRRWSTRPARCSASFLQFPTPLVTSAGAVVETLGESGPHRLVQAFSGRFIEKCRGRGPRRRRGPWPCGPSRSPSGPSAGGPSRSRKYSDGVQHAGGEGSPGWRRRSPGRVMVDWGSLMAGLTHAGAGLCKVQSKIDAPEGRFPRATGLARGAGQARIVACPMLLFAMAALVCRDNRPGIHLRHISPKDVVKCCPDVAGAKEKFYLPRRAWRQTREKANGPRDDQANDRCLRTWTPRAGCSRPVSTLF